MYLDNFVNYANLNMLVKKNQMLHNLDSTLLIGDVVNEVIK
ncbi:hypothetical protein [Methanobrevibacter sp.]|nr:hypothetical protein [uncultured Methanobrevibacter sp.]